MSWESPPHPVTLCQRVVTLRDAGGELMIHYSQ
jgi:hypothetical protein